MNDDDARKSEYNCVTTNRNRPTGKSAKGTTSRRYATHLVIILHNGPLPRACVDPCHKVFHMSGDEHGGVSDGLRSDADMTLLYCPYCLCCIS